MIFIAMGNLWFRCFNGKKWEKFNSEKVASLAYARIHGKATLVAHFQNSSLMNEDKRCRPILFHSKGSEAVHQVTHNETEFIKVIFLTIFIIMLIAYKQNLLFHCSILVIAIFSSIIVIRRLFSVLLGSFVK